MADKKTEVKATPEVVEKATGKALSEQKKVWVRIPADKLNKHDVVVPVCVNGYTYQIKRGERVEVPQTVADILENAGYLG